MVTSGTGAPGDPADGTRAVVGRDAELHAIREWVDELPSGPSAVVINGEPRIGKTTLWREAVVAVEEAGHAVIRCRPTPAESELPYVGLGDPFAGVPDEVLAALPSPQRAALDMALLRASDEGAALQRRAVAAAVLSTLAAWSRATPVVVAIDDLQWRRRRVRRDRRPPRRHGQPSRRAGCDPPRASAPANDDNGPPSGRR